MSREIAPEKRRVRRTVSMGPDLDAWLSARVEGMQARSYSHAVEACVSWCRRELVAKERRDTVAKEGK